MCIKANMELSEVSTLVACLGVYSIFEYLGLFSY